MNTENNDLIPTHYDNFIIQDEDKQIAQALRSPHANETQVQTRLEQINEVIRHYPEEIVAQRWPDLKKERDNYIYSAGELDPWLLLKQMGFKVNEMPSGKSATFDYEGKQLQISIGFHSKDKITIHHREHYKETGKHEHVEIPKTIEGVYVLINKYRPPIMVGAKHLATYESNYVKQLKSKKK